MVRSGVKSFLKASWYPGLLAFILVVFGKLYHQQILEISKILDTYLKLILSSWPAVILIIFLLILLGHKEAVDLFIRRIKSIGSSGVETFPIEEQRNSEASTESLRTSIAQLQGALLQQGKKTLFERIYSNIFGSQLSLLSLLNATPAGMRIVNATQFYMNAAVQYPTIRNYPFADYLNYLKNAGLVALPPVEEWQTTGMATITPLGREFLTYIMSEGLPLTKPL